MQRDKTIDVARGIAIVLLVFGHNWIVLHRPNEIYRIIFSFNLPLFFFLSGVYLRRSKTLRLMVASKLDTLLKPYFVVLISFFALKTLAGFEFNIKSLAGIFYGTGNTIAWQEWQWMPMWFLPHLFVVFIFSFVFMGLIGRHRISLWGKLSFIVLLLITGITTINWFWPVRIAPSGIFSFLSGKELQLPGLPFSLDLILITSAFFCAGHALSRHVRTIEINLSGLSLAMAIFAGCHILFNETMDLNARTYGNASISTLQAVTGIYISLSLSNILTAFNYLGDGLAFIGSGTLFILIFHTFFQWNATSFFSSIVGLNMYASSAIGFIVGIIGPLFLLEIARRNSTLSAMLLPKKLAGHG
ncbi:MAG: acyltransferase family protein [Nitrospirae bacterium]|nr:acyltransferase family protein [Nitrospirota bacterium]